MPKVSNVPIILTDRVFRLISFMLHYLITNFQQQLLVLSLQAQPPRSVVDKNFVLLTRQM